MNYGASLSSTDYFKTPARGFITLPFGTFSQNEPTLEAYRRESDEEYAARLAEHDRKKT
jgi:ADP-ribose pyrophosphatase YjhB (NUDIX family)